VRNGCVVHCVKLASSPVATRAALQMPGRYFTGDGAVKDADGDICILGRTDGERGGGHSCLLACARRAW
jgi:hypothetical protein